MAYDSSRGQTVLFGGTDGENLNDTWVWDGATWKNESPQTSPLGVYQFDVTVPAIADNNLAPLTFKLGGLAGAQTLYTAVKK
jgi:hypothetical protein